MKQLTATMAGTVLNIRVSQGESVSAGQMVMTLESMKMEIPVEAEFSGQVEKVNVEVGSFVNEGDTLVTLGE
ncbi:acetyl-CoA carboxylase biotin carboxyl carrier protein subunit [Planococcus sp. ISL-109]|uniref:acetyl-CoA carboxylase biotin carboxyl carrier protein subunit n=1 Tax=Planococcus sp. ISL-109 TaxID=2819166 RepID=UPI001BE9307D|nr:acetyl-CoA carboxylase biotin carboxyl carrier protein subunit [Planococcus sp. ISL-109]MBT2581846.1 acetyl-CoA carboxylase biotin carboxyl carrier protein subunit [Planococcus sp. ISL-109]